MVDLPNFLETLCVVNESLSKAHTASNTEGVFEAGTTAITRSDDGGVEQNKAAPTGQEKGKGIEEVVEKGSKTVGDTPVGDEEDDFETVLVKLPSDGSEKEIALEILGPPHESQTGANGGCENLDSVSTPIEDVAMEVGTSRGTKSINEEGEHLESRELISLSGNAETGGLDRENIEGLMTEDVHAGFDTLTGNKVGTVLEKNVAASMLNNANVDEEVTSLAVEDIEGGGSISMASQGKQRRTTIRPDPLNTPPRKNGS